MKIIRNNIFRSIFCSIFIISVIFVISEYSACHPKTPQIIGSLAEPFLNEGVYVQAKAYDGHDSLAYLNQDLRNVGVQPVQVTIQNNTKNTYILSAWGVDIPNASPSRVSSYVTARGIPKSIALKVAGLLFWPFLIPATIDTIVTVKSHVKMQSDFHAKSIKAEGEAIVPYSTVNRILFVPEEHYTDSFNLSLRDPNSRHLSIYPVKINS